MRYTIAVFLILTATVQAGEHRYPSGLVVSDDIAVRALPDSAKTMSDSQYFAWANEQNKQALAAVPPQDDHITNTANVSESSGSSQTRFGGGVGYGGFGGSGGYAGYLGGTDQQGSSFGFRFGGGRPGNSMQSHYSTTNKSYQLLFHSWPSYNAGGAMLLNPYCRPRG